VERRLAAILAADVVGYSRLIRADEEGTIAALKALRAELIDPKLAEHNGRVVKLMGDGMLAEFASVVDAVRAAVQTQAAVAERNANLPEDKRIAFRVGINLGDVVIDGDDIHGDGVNVAARLEGMAEPGGMCVSGSVYDQVRDRIDLTFEDMGEQEVKNIDRPVRVWRWSTKHVTTVVGAAKAMEPLPLADKPSLAVLPFENMSGDPEQGYFADGIAEDIITGLSHLQWLFVIARNSTFAYRSQSVDVKKVGQELGVRYVLEGSVRKSGNRVRITAQLIDTTTGSHVWADRYDGDLEDIFALQDKITATIVSTLGPELTGAEIERAKKKRPENLDAWDYYLRALPGLHDMTKEGFDEATALLHASIKHDPKFSTAHAFLANCYTWAAYHGWFGRTREAVSEAEKHARRAIKLDPGNAFAHEALGRAFLISDRASAVTSLKRALELNPNLSSVYGFLANAYAFLGRADEAFEAFAKGERGSPRDPDRWYRLVGLFNAHFTKGQYDKAVEIAKQVNQIKPMFYGAHVLLAASSALLGNLEEARAAIDKLRLAAPQLSLGGIRKNPLWDHPETADRLIEGLRLAGLPE
jgi:adenylate cyclase